MQSPTEHKGWYSRGYLPHFDNPTLVQMITFRLADSLPGSMLEYWREVAEKREKSFLTQQIEAYLDAGHGSCCLRDPRAAQLMQTALLFFDGERYRLLAWVIMPNHVHVLIETFERFPLGRVVHAWKSFTSRKINEALGRKGQLWQREYHDRFIRNEKHLMAAIYYIHENPVKPNS